MIQFYKPNSRNTGSACSVYYSTSNKCFFIQLLKQDGWDGKNGKFGSSRNNPAKDIRVKMTPIEVADMLLTLEGGGEFKFYHDFPGGHHSVSGSLSIYKPSPDAEPIGYSLSFYKKDKQDTTKQATSIRVGLLFKEARLLREYLQIGLKEILVYREEKKDEPKSPNPEPSPQAAPTSEGEPNGEPAPVF